MEFEGLSAPRHHCGLIALSQGCHACTCMAMKLHILGDSFVPIFIPILCRPGNEAATVGQM